MKRRITMPVSIFDSIDELCDRCKVDWFYNEYRERQTIDIADLMCLLDAFDDANVELPDDIKTWLIENK